MLLRDVSGLYELVTTSWGAATRPGAHRVDFAHPEEILTFVRRFLGSPREMPLLRLAVASDLPARSPRTADAEIVAHVARSLDAGRWCLYRLPLDVEGGGKGPIPELPYERPPPAPEARVPEIVACRWSKRRAWQTDEVSMIIDTVHVPPGSRAEITVWESDRDEGTPDDKISRVVETTRGDRTEVFYSFRLTPQDMARESRLEGRTQEFYFLVSLPSFDLKRASDLIYVPIPTYVYG